MFRELLDINKDKIGHRFMNSDLVRSISYEELEEQKELAIE